MGVKGGVNIIHQANNSRIFRMLRSYQHALCLHSGLMRTVTNKKEMMTLKAHCCRNLYLTKSQSVRDLHCVLPPHIFRAKLRTTSRTSQVAQPAGSGCHHRRHRYEPRYVLHVISGGSLGTRFEASSCHMKSFLQILVCLSLLSLHLSNLKFTTSLTTHCMF